MRITREPRHRVRFRIIIFFVFYYYFPPSASTNPFLDEIIFTEHDYKYPMKLFPPSMITNIRWNYFHRVRVQKFDKIISTECEYKNFDATIYADYEYKNSIKLFPPSRTTKTSMKLFTARQVQIAMFVSNGGIFAI